MRQVSRARAEELALRQEDGPVDVVAAVRAADWDIWAAWLLGEDPSLAVNLLPAGQRQRWLCWVETWRRRAGARPEYRRAALDRWHWVSGAPVARKISEGSALYVVSRGRLRLRIELDARLSSVASPKYSAGLVFKRRSVPGRKSHLTCGDQRSCGCPVMFRPVTLDEDVPSPRGMRRRWWPLDVELPCPDWRGTALGFDS